MPPFRFTGVPFPQFMRQKRKICRLKFNLIGIAEIGLGSVSLDMFG